ncbi:MAG: disulfide bond formation protein B [Desulfovibrio sp.]|jgi:disulfide bond formation protein DsbB|nr:disulfide bond formation protein B [Desulfovibrio sp.]
MTATQHFQKISRYTPLFNALWVTVLLCVIGGSLFIQFVIGDLPCRLCMWQRMSMMLIVAVLLVNLRFGQNMRNYGIILIIAVFGASVSIRQILSYIAPGSPGYGPAVFGLHTYTWALLVFVCSILASAVMLILNSTPKDGGTEPLPEPVVKGLIGVTMAVALTLSVATFFQCGLDVCPGAREYLYGSH